MEPDKSAALIDWAGRNFSTAVFVNYEQVRYSFNSTDISTAEFWRRCLGKALPVIAQTTHAEEVAMVTQPWSTT